MKPFKLLLLSTMVAFFTACGGGSSSDDTVIDDTPTNNLPFVDAGEDKSTEVDQAVNILGIATDTDGTIVSYEWTKDNTVISTTASFEYIPTTVGTDTLTFIVMDDDGATASDSMNVTVTDAPAPNIPPVANAGPDLSVELNSGSGSSGTTTTEEGNQTVTITGIAIDADGIIVAYEWSNDTGVLATTASFEYTPISVGTDTLTFTITDDDGATGSDSMNITITESTGGGGSTTPTEPTNANGIWSGTEVVNGVSYEISFIVYNNLIGGLSVRGLSFAGGTTIQENQLDGNYLVYDLTTGTETAPRIGQGIMTGTVIEQLSIEGSFHNFYDLGTDEGGTFSVSFDDQYNKPSSLSYIAGDYNTNTLDFTISSTGEISGNIGDCLATGNVEVPDPLVNIYYVSYTLDSCSEAGDYNGVGTIRYDIDNDVYIFNAGMFNSESSHLAYVEVPKPSTF